MKADDISVLEREAMELLAQCKIQYFCNYENVRKQNEHVNMFVSAVINEFQEYCQKKIKLNLSDIYSKNNSLHFRNTDFPHVDVDIEDILWDFVRLLPKKLGQQLENEATNVKFAIQVDDTSALDNCLEKLGVEKNRMPLQELVNAQILQENVALREVFLDRIEHISSYLHREYRHENKADYIAHSFYSHLVAQCYGELMKCIGDYFNKSRDVMPTLTELRMRERCVEAFRIEWGKVRSILKEYYAECISRGKDHIRNIEIDFLTTTADRIKNCSYELRTKEPVDKSTFAIKKNSLIDRNFFPAKISIDITRIFPVMVIATMSSGKSTLINALLEKDILPSRNEACTAKIYSILDVDSDEEMTAYVLYKNGETELIDANLKEKLDESNQNVDVSQIFISGNIRGVLNTDRSLLLIDTPGPNNSRDFFHEELTKSTLQKLYGGLILYVINATQMGINDDFETLQLIKAHLEKHKDIDILFVLNKVDELDIEDEEDSIEKLIKNVRDYIESVGIKNPNIVPISALAANLFQKALAGEQMTRFQQRKFANLYDLYKSTDFNMKAYVVNKGIVADPVVKIGTREYKKSQLNAALENTGIPYLEDYIQDAQILSSQNVNGEMEIRQEK